MIICKAPINFIVNQLQCFYENIAVVLMPNWDFIFNEFCIYTDRLSNSTSQEQICWGEHWMNGHQDLYKHLQIIIYKSILWIFLFTKHVTLFTRCHKNSTSHCINSQNLNTHDCIRRIKLFNCFKQYIQCHIHNLIHHASFPESNITNGSYSCLYYCWILWPFQYYYQHLTLYQHPSFLK